MFLNNNFTHCKCARLVNGASSLTSSSLFNKLNSWYVLSGKSRGYTKLIIRVQSMHRPVMSEDGTASTHESILGDDTINWEIIRPYEALVD